MSETKKKRSRRTPVSQALRESIRDRDLTAYAAAKRRGPVSRWTPCSGS